MIKNYSLSGIKIVAQDKILDNSAISINNGVIEELDKKNKLNLEPGKNYILYPALINIHNPVM